MMSCSIASVNQSSLKYRAKSWSRVALILSMSEPRGDRLGCRLNEENLLGIEGEVQLFRALHHEFPDLRILDGREFADLRNRAVELLDLRECRNLGLPRFHLRGDCSGGLRDRA